MYKNGKLFNSFTADVYGNIYFVSTSAKSKTTFTVKPSLSFNNLRSLLPHVLQNKYVQLSELLLSGLIAMLIMYVFRNRKLIARRFKV